MQAIKEKQGEDCGAKVAIKDDGRRLGSGRVRVTK